MATPDYSKIWGANSPLAKYEFTEADYLRGWEFIGSMPPARTMFDAWMRKADEKMRWLYDNAFSENSLGGFLFWRLPDTAYFVGEKRALQDGPLDVYLECTIAGRTSKEQMKKLPQGAEIGKTFVDGTVTWLVRQFATNAALADHRTKTPLDHPDGSVLKKHLGFEVYDKGEVYNKNEINQSYREIGNRTVEGNVDWNTLTEPTTYKIQNCVMDATHHAPLGEYNFGLLVVNRLENGASADWRTVQIYFPHSTRGYWSRMHNGSADYRAEDWSEWRYIPTHNEVETIAEQKASKKVSKSGDTMTGALKFEDTSESITSCLPSHYFHNLFQDGNTVFMHAFPSHPSPAKTTQFEFRTANGEQGHWVSHTLSSSGFATPGIMFGDAGYIGDRRRDTGNAVDGNGGANVNIGSWWGLGFYDMCNKKYTGSMDLRSGNWYTLGTIRAQGGFDGYLHGTADNANTVGEKSLQWILEQVKAANTGIVASNLEPNGWIKFANGLIVQWGIWPASVQEKSQWFTFPLAFPSRCFKAIVGTSLLQEHNNADLGYQVIALERTRAKIMTQHFSTHILDVLGQIKAAPEFIAIGI